MWVDPTLCKKNQQCSYCRYFLFFHLHRWLTKWINAVSLMKIYNKMKAVQYFSILDNLNFFLTSLRPSNNFFFLINCFLDMFHLFRSWFGEKKLWIFHLAKCNFSPSMLVLTLCWFSKETWLSVFYIFEQMTRIIFQSQCWLNDKQNI